MVPFKVPSSRDQSGNNVLRRSSNLRIIDPQGTAPRPPRRVRERERHALGSIIWMAMLRLTVAIFGAWWLLQYIPSGEYGTWWAITVAAIYGIAIYPAQLQYGHFRQSNAHLIEGVLCSSCRHFNADGLHCLQLDEHISETYLPCQGESWEPKSFENV